MPSRPIPIRPEEREDYLAVDGLNRCAFGRDDGARLVEALRDLPEFTPGNRNPIA